MFSIARNFRGGREIITKCSLFLAFLTKCTGNIAPLESLIVASLPLNEIAPEKEHNDTQFLGQKQGRGAFSRHIDVIVRPNEE
ncbi:hypothetical protein KSC_069290 [Ktedonobacter sp. SOSP1-52]|nr:hypothetical protein KSC_069290 [Ktedonobacter sp. SOSP1-52]